MNQYERMFSKMTISQVEDEARKFGLTYGRILALATDEKAYERYTKTYKEPKKVKRSCREWL